MLLVRWDVCIRREDKLKKQSNNDGATNKTDIEESAKRKVQNRKWRQQQVDH